MTDQSDNSTLQATWDSEHLSATKNVKVKVYHIDNGRFSERSFTDDVKVCQKCISHCDVGTHHQNGITENTTKQLTLITHTLLVHAQNYWPEYITTMLWKFALKAAQDRMNQLNINLEGKTPDMILSGVAAVLL